MNDKLMNCPFCGKQPLSACLSSNTPTIECCYSIACEPTAEATIAAWNQRVDPVKAQLVEALKAVLSRGCGCHSTTDEEWHATTCPVPQARKALADAEAE